MPGLMRGIARTAVVAGTATAVSNRVSRRQAARWSGDDQSQQPPPQQQQYVEQPQQYAPPPPQAVAPAPPADDMLDQLRQLGELRAAGILTEEEFIVQKSKILAAG